MHRTGKHLRASGSVGVGIGIRPTGTVAEIADHRGAENALAALAGQRSRASLRYERQMTGVEVRAEGRNHVADIPARRGGPRTRATCRCRILRALGIDKESGVLFDDPPIVLGSDRKLRLTVD